MYPTDPSIPKTPATEEDTNTSATASREGPNAATLRDTSAARPIESPRLVIDLIAEEEGTTQVVVDAFRSFGVTLRRHTKPINWFTTLSRGGDEAGPSELVVLAGDANQMLTEDWVRRVKVTYPHAVIVVALTNPSLRSVTQLLKHGIRTFVELPSAVDRIVDDLGWLVHQTSASREKIRSAHQSRLNIAKLTKAEVEVLRLMLDGQANKQIAQQLGIGLRTVELRRSKIMRKMNSATVSQLMRFVYESGVDVFAD